MKIFLRTKFIISFTVVVVLTGLVIAWAGVLFIGRGIIREAQKRVEMDLNSAREIYNSELECVEMLISLTADRFFIRAGLQKGSIVDIGRELVKVREDNGLDILTLTDRKGKVIVRTRGSYTVGDSQADDELVRKALEEKKSAASTEIISSDELMKEGGDLAEQSYIKIIPTPKAKPSDKEFEASGMFIKAASPVNDDNGTLIGALYGGKLLNRNYVIVDKVANTVFRGEVYKGKNIGTATIFQGDLRISTNVISNNGKRAVGTRVSKEVAAQVLEKGKPWIDRAFVVNNWYITAYEPIKNIKGDDIGILYVGILEQKYEDLKRHTLFIFFLITLVGIVTSFIIAYILSHNITGPLKELVTASGRLAEGKLDSRVKCGSNDELGELGKSFNAMASSIKEREEILKEYTKQGVMRSEKLATLGQLAASVAHEINNPLAVIMGRAEFLASEIENDDPIIQKSIGAIEKESEKAASTVKRFLTFARRTEPEFKLVNINQLLDTSLGLSSHLAIMEKITVEKEFEKEIPEIRVDPTQIEQVFINIILNAIQSMRSGGKLIVYSAKKKDKTEIRFVDNGCGISKENRDNIFDPFFTTKKAGTGLGLAICKQIIEKHDGTIRIESEINNGTLVIITLPSKELRSNGK